MHSDIVTGYSSAISYDSEGDSRNSITNRCDPELTGYVCNDVRRQGSGKSVSWTQQSVSQAASNQVASADTAMKHSQHDSSGWIDRVTVCTSCGFDALVILVYLAVVDVTILSGATPPVVRAFLGIPLLLFLPGYAVTAALFPRAVDRLRTADHHRAFGTATDGALLPGERLALSFGTSLAVLPLLGLVHGVTGIGYSPQILVGLLNTVILLGLALGVARRLQTPRRDRVAFAPGTWPAKVKARLTSRSQFDTVLLVGLVVVMVVATSGLSYALVSPGDGETYTTVKLLTENESGDLVTDGYPEELSPGESASLVLGVENHENAQTSYTVVTELQSVREENGSTTVLKESELGRTSQTVPAGDTWYNERSVTPDLAGERLRLVFLVYRGEPADDPEISNAYRYVHVSFSGESE